MSNIFFKYVIYFTGKFLSEALIFAATIPQYENRLFIELQVHYTKIPSSNLGRKCCVQKLFPTFRTIFVHIMFSPCSDKDLPVQRLKNMEHRPFKDFMASLVALISFTSCPLLEHSVSCSVMVFIEVWATFKSAHCDSKTATLRPRIKSKRSNRSFSLFLISIW